MNRALSILALFPIVTFAITGCSGSGGTTDVGPAPTSSSNGSDAGTTNVSPADASVVVNGSDAGSPSTCSGAGCVSLR